MAQCLNSNRALNLLSGKRLHQFQYARLSLTARATFYICVLSLCLHQTWHWTLSICWPWFLLQSRTLSMNRSDSRSLYSAYKPQPSFECDAWTEARAGFQQVVFAVLKRGTELRSIYRFYSRLGRTQAPYSLFQLTRLQLWRLLKDCYIHHHFTLSQTDQLINQSIGGEGEFPPILPPCGSALWASLTFSFLCVSDEATVMDVHSPFTPIFLRQLLSLLVVLAYHIYHKDLT